MDLEEIAKQYVDRKKKIETCLLNRAVGACNRCEKWQGCSVYLEYFDAWKALERKVNG